MLMMPMADRGDAQERRLVSRQAAAVGSARACMAGGSGERQRAGKVGGACSATGRIHRRRRCKADTHAPQRWELQQWRVGKGDDAVEGARERTPEFVHAGNSSHA